MAGRAQINEYGWFHLAANPNWKPVSTLDSSGKGYMHSLHYLLPLLRRGVKTGNKDMIDRFYFLIHDWFKDNKPGGPTSRYAWGPPIYEGFRSLVLVCAAAGPRGNAPWLLKALKQNGEMAARADRYEGINNASLHQSMGLYAIGVAHRPAGLAPARDRADPRARRAAHARGRLGRGRRAQLRHQQLPVVQPGRRADAPGRRPGAAGAVPGRRDPRLHRARHPPGRPGRGAR